jgi:hypothetical protein
LDVWNPLSLSEKALHPRQEQTNYKLRSELDEASRELLKVKKKAFARSYEMVAERTSLSDLHSGHSHAVSPHGHSHGHSESHSTVALKSRPAIEVEFD